MAILKSCCCWRSVRQGSFASAIFTLIFYSVIAITGSVHVNNVLHSPELLVLSILIIVFAGLCVASSVILLVGLFLDYRLLLLPWVFSVTITTLINIISFFYLFNDAIYCILCVVSQYQEYLSGRGRTNCRSEEGSGSRHYNVRFNNPNQRSELPKVTIKISENGTKTSSQILLPSNSMSNSRSQKSSELTSISEEHSSDFHRSVDDTSCEESAGHILSKNSSELIPNSPKPTEKESECSKIKSGCINRSMSLGGKVSSVLSPSQDSSEDKPLIISALGNNSTPLHSTAASRSCQHECNRKRSKRESTTLPYRSYTCPVGFDNVTDKKTLAFKKFNDARQKISRSSNYSTML
ncbi:uncharacterized protein LOC111089133 isoform X2 [Limulus polyphemus]|uniref:Uncharacterized protein LOC111089133 isoform X2 n=1 Tax=Limulus polyphemus TaxID=6850 RepID=A0ABM1TLI5_LIMPO|nr:uncharacterized protein LOC111089133 isoform X2 [Limulus polyphemus]